MFAGRPLKLVLLVLILPEAGLASQAEEERKRQKESASVRETRTGRWHERRLERLEQIRPSENSFIETLFLKIDESLPRKAKRPRFFVEQTALWEKDEDKRQGALLTYHGFSPTVGRVTFGSGPALGFRYQRPDLGGSGLELLTAGAVSTKGYQYYVLKFGDTGEDGKFFAHSDFRYRFFPEEDFFGIGPNSSELERSDYRLEDRFFGGVAGYRFTPWLRAAVRFGYLDVSIGRGRDDSFPDIRESFSSGPAPGLARQPDFLEFDSVLFLDYRDVPGKPHKGGVAGITFSRFDDRGGNDFEFNRLAFEARHYLSLFSPERVLALRFYTSSDDPGEGRVPFYLQETLGGENLLRGFDRQRFRDEKLLYMSAEYRWEPALFLQLVLFYDTGKVFSDFGDFGVSGLKKSWGGGVRITTKESVLFRFDIGRSNEGTQLIFGLGPSF